MYILMQCRSCINDLSSLTTATNSSSEYPNAVADPA